MTNERIDVLAVMDDAAHALNHTKTASERAALLEARAAVAELIDAAIDAHDFAANTARNEGEELDRRFYRLRAALARVGGAPA